MKALTQTITFLMFLSVAATGAEPWTLERALDFGLAHNPDARLAQQRIAIALAGLDRKSVV
mgnify:CR=1 FL=1